MTFFWLLVWLLNSTPDVHAWNNWAVGLLVCVVIDLLGTTQSILD